ncbi:MAG: 16S rRNA (guanine(966)-N(2))-methyltransferase RsmD [Planctomycetota bacterium]|nr:MAG: 16S rRNA (guanine(966)-N(2))-methyltransferase RsmD [Planctomycetota bacterium]
MLRITAGEHRGRKLRVPAVASTRPLPERARQGLMNHLRALIPEAVIWDVYAGSGILGFEALSRGAARVVAVERHRAAAAQLRASAAELGYADRHEVAQVDVRSFLDQAPRQPPNLLFYDPPYAAFRGSGRPETWELFCALAARLAPGGCAVVHAPKGLLAPHERAQLSGLEERVYGSSSLYWWHKGEE